MQPDKKTLIILSPGFPAAESDTTCLPAQQQFLRSLHEEFPDMKLIVLAFQYPFRHGQYKWGHVQVFSFNGRNRGGLKRLFLWYEIRRKLSSLYHTHSIAGIISFWCTECALVGNHFARKHGLKHFGWILGQDARKTNRFVRLIKPAPHALVAMSDFLADEFERSHGVRPQHIITNGINPQMFPLAPVSRDLDVLGAGSLIPLKQYNLFAEVISIARKKFPDIKALLCGKGPEDRSLRANIEALDLEGTLHLTGELAHGDVLQYMRRAKIFLHTSSYEGFSSVCLEALYAGAHVISFCKPMHINIRHWHVVRDKTEMIAKLTELLSFDALEHDAVFPFSMKDIALSWMKLFTAAAVKSL